MLRAHQVGQALGEVEVVHPAVAHAQLLQHLKGGRARHPGGDIEDEELDLQLAADEAELRHGAPPVGKDTSIITAPGRFVQSQFSAAAQVQWGNFRTVLQ